VKTRREFMRFTLGGLACLGAAVMAPKTLLAQETKNPFNLDSVKEGLKKMDYPSATSGYVHVGEDLELPDYTTTTNGTYTITVDSESFEDGSFLWKTLVKHSKKDCITLETIK